MLESDVEDVVAKLTIVLWCGFVDCRCSTEHQCKLFLRIIHVYCANAIFHQVFELLKSLLSQTLHAILVCQRVHACVRVKFIDVGGFGYSVDVYLGGGVVVPVAME